jgi:AraC-like DNA-binding protein
MIFNTRPDLNVNKASILVYNVVRQEFTDVLRSNDCDELVLITQGSGNFQIDSSEATFGPGTIAYVRAGTLRFWKAETRGGQSIPVSGLVIQIPIQALSTDFLELEETVGVRAYLKRIGRGGHVRLKAYQRIEARWKTILGAKGMLRIARTHALLDLLSSVDGWQVIEEEELAGRSGKDQARLKRVYHYLEDHFSSRVERNALAELVGMEPNSFSRFFRRASGQKLADYLAVIRVRHAAKLLGARRRMPVSKIASESGFRNVSAFNRQFKKRLGVTPRSYRKKLNTEPVQP